jgi:hypothetical protein
MLEVDNRVIIPELTHVRFLLVLFLLIISIGFADDGGPFEDQRMVHEAGWIESEKI